MLEPLDYIPAGLRPHGPVLSSAIADVLSGMGQMGVVAAPPDRQRLLRRLDTKYSLPRARLPELLVSLADRFTILTAGGHYAARYVTVYFDDAERRFLTDHLRGRRPRHKLRVRHYLERGLSSLEIKVKMPSGRTDKQQRAHAFGSNALDVGERHWAAQITGRQDAMQPVAWTSCQRITLLHAHAACRLTIDLNIALGNEQGARSLPDRALLELKREQAVGDPALSPALHAAGARPLSFSKYVAAMMDPAAAAAPARARFAAVLGRLARPECWRECHA